MCPPRLFFTNWILEVQFWNTFSSIAGEISCIVRIILVCRSLSVDGSCMDVGECRISHIVEGHSPNVCARRRMDRFGSSSTHSGNGFCCAHISCSCFFSIVSERACLTKPVHSSQNGSLRRAIVVSINEQRHLWVSRIDPLFSKLIFTIL